MRTKGRRSAPVCIDVGGTSTDCLFRFDGREVNAPVYNGDKLLAGNRIDGAAVEETATTVVVPGSFPRTGVPSNNYVLVRKDEARA